MRILEKYEDNPIIKPSMLEGVLYTFNPGAVKYKDEYIIIMDATTDDITDIKSSFRCIVILRIKL